MTKGGAKAGKSWKYFGLSQLEINELFNDKKEWQVRRELKRMKQRKLIKDQKRGTEAFYILTESGKTILLRKIVKEVKKELPNDTYCYVIFDIPESARQSRFVLRQVLEDANFKYVQRSVWASRLDVAPYLVELIRYAGIEKWVKVIVGKQFN